MLPPAVSFFFVFSCLYFPVFAFPSQKQSINIFSRCNVLHLSLPSVFSFLSPNMVLCPAAPEEEEFYDCVLSDPIIQRDGGADAVDTIDTIDTLEQEITLQRGCSNRLRFTVKITPKETIR